MRKQFLFIALCVSAAAFAQSAESDFETKAHKDGGVIITKYAGWDKAVTIPAKISGKPVTAIGQEAFSSNELTSVVIPNSVTFIESEAFSGNEKLTSVTLGANCVMSEGSIDARFYTDYFCNSRKAGTYKIVNRSKKTEEDFTYVATPYGACIWKYRGSSKRVKIPEKLGGLTVTYIDGAFIDWVFKDKNIEAVLIPNTVTGIGDGAFSGYHVLTNITIPASVTSIGSYAFSNCTGLTSMTLPGSVTSIGASAFSGCTNLSAITVDAANTAFFVQDGVLYDKPATRVVAVPAKLAGAVTIPNGVISVGGFGGTAITSVSIPGSVTSIGATAFSCCTGLTSVTIPASVTSIGAGAFDGCTALTSVTFQGSNTAVPSFSWYEPFPSYSSLLSAGDAASNGGRMSAGTYTLSGSV
ncbi:MAG: leucine-rich repeat domain-containing protein [Treponematales bacterium]